MSLTNTTSIWGTRMTTTSFNIGDKVEYIHDGQIIRGVIWHIYENPITYLIKTNPSATAKFVVPESAMLSKITCENAILVEQGE